MAPLFDHNISLLPYAEEGDFDFNGKYFREKGPRIGDSWVRVAAACMDADTRKVLINLKDFKFKKHNKYNLPDWRLEALEKLIHQSVDAVLDMGASRFANEVDGF